MLDTFSWNLILRSGTTLLQGTGICSGALSRLCGRNLKGTCAIGWLRGLDLNQRPLGYEPNKPMARLCFSMIYMHLASPFYTLFQGVLFSICSSICSRGRDGEGERDWEPRETPPKAATQEGPALHPESEASPHPCCFVCG